MLPPSQSLLNTSGAPGGAISRGCGGGPSQER